MSDRAIRLQCVSFQYSRQSKYILKDFSFEACAGTFTCILGPSGIGKTTLLYLMAGCVPPGSGTITHGDVSVISQHPHRGVVFQDLALFDWLTAEENVMFSATVDQDRANEMREQASKLLTYFGLDDAKEKYTWQLSGGMRQRVALARTLVPSPSFLLLDEPFSSLDFINKRSLQVLVRKITQEGSIGCVMVTHNPEDALYCASRIVVVGGNPLQVVDDFSNECVGCLIDNGNVDDDMAISFHRLRRRIELSVEYASKLR